MNVTWFYLFAWPLVCGSNVEVVRCFASIEVHNIGKIFLLNCAPLSVKTKIDMPFCTRQWSKKRFTICVGVVCNIVTAEVDFE